MAKQCRKCGTEKPLSEFFRNKGTKDGYLGRCKPCAMAANRESRDKHRDKVKAREQAYRERRKDWYTEIKAAYRQSHKGEIAAYMKEYRQVNLDRLSAQERGHRQEHPERTRAHQILHNAVRRGEMTRPTQCEACESICTPQGHHADYSKPLDVEWLCHRHHAARHRA